MLRVLAGGAPRYWKGALWSPSYFAASGGGAPLSVVRQYLEQQRTPHQKPSTPTPSALSFPAL